MKLVFFSASLIIALLHWMAWTASPPDHDAVNFFLALDRYDVSADRPHTPGYPLLVALAKTASIVVGPGNAYQLVNLLFLLGTGWCLFYALQANYLGMAAALLYMTHPLVFSTSVQQQSYITDGALPAALLAAALWCRKKPPLASGLVMACVLGTQGLIRPTTSYLMLPLATALMYFQSSAKALYTIALGIVMVVAGYWLTVAISGGSAVYTESWDRNIGAAYHATSYFGGADWSVHQAMVVKFIVWFGALSLLPLLCLAILWLRKGAAPFREIPLSTWAIGACWVLPPILFYLTIYYLKPPYQLIFLPCLSIIMAWALLRSFVSWLPLILLIALQQAFFWYPWQHLPKPLFMITHEWLIEANRSYQALDSELQKLNLADTLVIYIKGQEQPVPFFALRILLKGDTYGLFDTQNRELSFFKVFYFHPTTEELARYRNLALVTFEGRQPKIITVPLNGPVSEELILNKTTKEVL